MLLDDDLHVRHGVQREHRNVAGGSRRLLVATLRRHVEQLCRGTSIFLSAVQVVEMAAVMYDAMIDLATGGTLCARMSLAGTA